MTGDAFTVTQARWGRDYITRTYGDVSADTVTFRDVAPRPGPAKPRIDVRLSAEDIELIEERAAAAGITRSEMVRILIGLGLDVDPLTAAIDADTCRSGIALDLGREGAHH